MKIFEIEDGLLKINENCLLIPELKAVVEAYEDPIPALAYVHYMTSPDSPYHNLEVKEKEEMISQDVGGDFSFDDEELIRALEKCKKLYLTPISEFYEGQKNALHVIGSYLKKVNEGSLDFSKDGNMAEISRWLREGGKTMKSFMELEKLWQEQTQQKLRGNAELGEY